MTADHLFSILESEADSEVLVQVASKLAVGDVPDEVIDGIRGGSVRIGKTRWRREGDRGRRHHQKISGQNHRKTVCQESRRGHCPVPVRPVDKGGL